MTTLYGIPNCDTVKKARKWLDENQIDYNFHNFKKDGLDHGLLDTWFQAIGWETLLNKRGTTWRKLPADIKDNIDQDSAKKIMLENASIIKRPVLSTETQYHVGFKPEDYQSIFS